MHRRRVDTLRVLTKERVGALRRFFVTARASQRMDRERLALLGKRTGSELEPAGLQAIDGSRAVAVAQLLTGAENERTFGSECARRCG